MVISLSAYLLLLIASSLVITSFFAITRGYTEVMPDGSVRRYGKIFCNYYFFWFREIGVSRCWYTGDRLAVLVHDIKQHFSGYIHIPVAIEGCDEAIGFEASALIMEVLPVLAQRLGICFEVEYLQADTVFIKACVQEPVYFFPQWTRMVMAGCITCIGSIYGNIIYWSIILMARKSILYNDLFSIFSNQAAGIICVWLAFWLSLAWINTILWNIYNRQS